ncbi:hypothetical protein [Christiangramia salexigens]|uniref:Uncharacterized protein n=1 Tax=Christiangramia salexigens TaxID=1913577 RepID=A0A1L3J6I7_9FLAO|nr:hypothetical protein [Christiangramia salexigens]APG60745.1 hypothetical protein LPB144_10170 [Christiangramia salexigens]
MIQEHLPKDKDPNKVQEWGWTLPEFIEENMWYLLAILLLLVLFFYARYRWRVRNQRNNNN